MSDQLTVWTQNAAPQWRCFHCDEVFTDEAEAREHFGASMDAQVACRLSGDDVKQLRALEALNAKLQRECENLENDARLWHEAEADRERRIGNHQWWFHVDCLEGEKIVLTEKLAATHAAIRALPRYNCDCLPQNSKGEMWGDADEDAKHDPIYCQREIVLWEALARLLGDPAQEQP